ncbi:MAG: histidinol-phosphate transaminase [Halocynthiibacter sp.]
MSEQNKTTPTPQPGIMDIALYVSGASHIAGANEVIKLSSNENPYGPPPAAIKALQDAAQAMHRYPNTDHGPLRNAIARTRGLSADRIICGVGSDEIISFLCYAYAGVDDEVIYTEHGFSMYKISARGAGAIPVVVREKNRVVDVDAILSAVTEKTKIVFVTNPGNPTGTRVPDADLARLVAALPAHIVLVLDGAYAEFSDGFDGGASMVEAHENVVMLRTFSKLYGLGGLRVGWGYGPKPIIDVLNRLRGPFNLSAPALAAAEAALSETDFVDMCIRENARLRTKLATALAALGIVSDPSHANFVLARFDSEQAAETADAMLQSKRIITRRVGGYGFPEGLRITIGDEAAIDAVIDALTLWKEAQ